MGIVYYLGISWWCSDALLKKKHGGVCVDQNPSEAPKEQKSSCVCGSNPSHPVKCLGRPQTCRTSFQDHFLDC